MTDPDTAVPRPQPLDTISHRVRTSTLVDGSRFVATIAPAHDRTDAAAIIDGVRRELRGATHHCTAEILGFDGDHERADDDGEPAGTAGAPMLDVLRGAGVSDVVAVVSRTFGGTLLGRGGLVRAYSGAVTAALSRSHRVARRELADLTVHVDLADVSRLEHRLRHWAVGTLGTDRGYVRAGEYSPDGACLPLAVPPELVAALAAELAGSHIAHRLEQLGTSVHAV